MIEKRWKAVPPQPFVADGTADGKITLAGACRLFKVKQQIILKSSAIPSHDILEVKRIVDENTLYVGLRSQNIDSRYDVSGYLVADSASIEAIEQLRSKIPEQEIERHTYEEEPVVARRTILVDECGNKINEDNPLPTTAQVTLGNVEFDVDLPDGIKVSAIPVVTANLEMNKVLLANSHAFTIKVRDGAAALKIAFASGDIALGKYVKISRGAFFNSGEMDLTTPFTLYFSADVAGVTVEIVNWHFN